MWRPMTSRVIPGYRRVKGHTFKRCKKMDQWIKEINEFSVNKEEE
jgi:hypothetical protein